MVWAGTKIVLNLKLHVRSVLVDITAQFRVLIHKQSCAQQDITVLIKHGIVNLVPKDLDVLMEELVGIICGIMKLGIICVKLKETSGVEKACNIVISVIISIEMNAVLKRSGMA